MGSGASLESVQAMDAEQLAQVAVDNKCPPIVKKTIEENFIDGATLQELKDEDFDEYDLAIDEFDDDYDL